MLTFSLLVSGTLSKFSRLCSALALLWHNCVTLDKAAVQRAMWRAVLGVSSTLLRSCFQTQALAWLLPELCCRWACAWSGTLLIWSLDLLNWLRDSPTLFAISLSGNQWALSWWLLPRDLFWVLWDCALPWWGHRPAHFAVTLSSWLIFFEEQLAPAAPWHSDPLVLGILTCSNSTLTAACCSDRAM